MSVIVPRDQTSRESLRAEHEKVENSGTTHNTSHDPKHQHTKAEREILWGDLKIVNTDKNMTVCFSSREPRILSKLPADSRTFSRCGRNPHAKEQKQTLQGTGDESPLVQKKNGSNDTTRLELPAVTSLFSSIFGVKCDLHRLSSIVRPSGRGYKHLSRSSFPQQ